MQTPYLYQTEMCRKRVSRTPLVHPYRSQDQAQNATRRSTLHIHVSSRLFLSCRVLPLVPTPRTPFPPDPRIPSLIRTRSPLALVLNLVIGNNLGVTRRGCAIARPRGGVVVPLRLLRRCSSSVVVARIRTITHVPGGLRLAVPDGSLRPTAIVIDGHVGDAALPAF